MPTPKLPAEIDAIAEKPAGNLTKGRKTELALHVKNCPSDKHDELFRIFQESDNKDEAAFVASLFNKEPAAVSANGATPITSEPGPKAPPSAQPK